MAVRFRSRNSLQPALRSPDRTRAAASGGSAHRTAGTTRYLKCSLSAVLLTDQVGQVPRRGQYKHRDEQQDETTNRHDGPRTDGGIWAIRRSFLRG